MPPSPGRAVFRCPMGGPVLVRSSISSLSLSLQRPCIQDRSIQRANLRRKQHAKKLILDRSLFIPLYIAAAVLDSEGTGSWITRGAKRRAGATPDRLVVVGRRIPFINLVRLLFETSLQRQLPPLLVLLHRAIQKERQKKASARHQTLLQIQEHHA